MDLYLPIAEMSVNALLVLGLGAGVGFLSGIFGVGGGFLMTPLLIFIGIPAAVAVATQAAQILASSVSGVLAHTRRQTVDFRMGWVLTAGGALGSTLGVLVFSWFKQQGQVDLLVAVLYVVFLGIVGGFMLFESVASWWRSRRAGGRLVRERRRRNWTHHLPLKVRFPRSRLRISLAMPFAVGFGVGMLGAMMGVGGGFIIVPAMIYFIGMPTAVVIGTSLFQITFVSALTTFLHAVNNGTVDVILAALLIVGGVVGAQWGSRVGAFLGGEQLRLLLALLVLAVAGKLMGDLVIEPRDRYSISREA